MMLHNVIVRQLSTTEDDLKENHWIQLYNKLAVFTSIIGYLWVPIISLAAIVVYHFLHTAS